MSNKKYEFELDFTKGVVTVDIKKLLTMINDCRPKKNPTPFTILKETHLGKNVETISQGWHGRKGELMLSTIEDYILEHYEQVDFDENMKNISYRSINFGQENEQITVMIEGLRALKPRDGSSKKHNLIISHDLDYDGDCRITVYFSSSDTDARTEAAIFIKEMQDFHWKNSPMRGKVFDMMFNVLERDNHSVESLTLNKNTQNKVDFHIIDYINSLNDLKENNIPLIAELY